MLIPQFSIRTLLVVTTVCAVFFSVVGLAVRGHSWAMGVSAGVLSLAVLAVCGTFLFSLVWIASAFWDRVRGSRASDLADFTSGESPDSEPNDSPFAQATAVESSETKNSCVPPGSTLCLFVFMATVVWGQHAFAQKIEPWHLSGEKRVVTGAGLTMEVDNRWVMHGGYRPTRITLTRAAAVQADRTLTVELHLFNEWYRGSNRLSVYEDFDIPAGSTKVSKIISVPELHDGRLEINVFENELEVKPLSDVTIDSSMGYMQEYGLAEGQTPAILFVGDDTPDTSQLCRPFGPDDDEVEREMRVRAMVRGTPGMLPPQPSGAKNPNKKAHILPLPSAFALVPAKLPTRWIDYTGLDVVCLSLKQLTALKKTNSRAFDAITAWTAAGGNLWVYGMGSNWERIGDLESLLVMTLSDAKARPSKEWCKPDAKDFFTGFTKDGKPTYIISWLRSDELMDSDPFETGDPSDQKKPDLSSIPAQFKEPHFVYRDYDMGMVVAIKAAEPFPGEEWQWGWILQATGPDLWGWNERHGIEDMGMNISFLNFLIPGVGLAPVWEFRILLTLFVLTIGPLNYFLLKRFRRLNLLVITIPAGAILVTAGLFAYAVVADGLSTRVRVRSATVIDQQHGRAVCWSRMCYYAGLAPSEGLTFPDDVAVIPIKPSSYYDSDVSRELIWDDEQWLSEGWLDARTLTQYLTLRSRSCTVGLEIMPSATGKDNVEVKNNLGTAIERLVVRMPDGKYFWVADVEQDAKTAAVAVEPAEIFRWLGKRHLQEQLEFPEGMERHMYPYDGMQDLNSSLLERKLASLGNFGSEAMTPGSYVAIVHRSPEVVLGLDGALEEGSFHVIFGTFGEETQK